MINNQVLLGGFGGPRLKAIPLTPEQLAFSILEQKLEYYAMKINIDVDIFKSNLSLLLAQKELLINAEEKEAALLAQKELLINAEEKEAALLAQVAASIGVAINFSSSISDSCGYLNVPLITTVNAV